MDSRELFGEVPAQEIAVEDIELKQDEIAENIVSEQGTEIPVSTVFDREKVEYRPEQIQHQVEENAQKGNNAAVMVVVTLLFILVIGLCVYIAVSVSNLIPENDRVDKEYESQTGDPWKEILGDDYKGDDQELQPEEEVSTENIYEYPNYAKDAFTGPYYEDVVDCIDHDVSYEVERKYYDVEEEFVKIHSSYIQLNGDIPGIDEINSRLENEATYFAKNYEDRKADIDETMEEAGTNIQAEIKSYVTYNTEQMISVVVYKKISAGYVYADISLRCININLDTGTILDNTSVLDLGSGFGQEFRERSDKQNGVSANGNDSYSNEEIEAMLNDENALILFYTPLGMEVGYNYSGSNYIGWITITMQDYEDYMSSV